MALQRNWNSKHTKQPTDGKKYCVLETLLGDTLGMTLLGDTLGMTLLGDTLGMTLSAWHSREDTFEKTLLA
eukprot:s692_g21.t1